MHPQARILIVDDEANARSALSELLREEGYLVETAADGFKALPKLDTFSPDVVLTDLRMPGMDGISLLQKIHVREQSCEVIIMTAYGAVETAVKAMQEGAAHYIIKPINIDELCVLLNRALAHRQLQKESGLLQKRLSQRYQIKNLIGSSPSIKSVCEMILQIAPSKASVLITGESGTGKELIAAALHEHSPRKERPFVKLHCAALTETLLESELFGHERGAFTGAISRRDGRFQEAHTGTLFLDEIGEISPVIQIKLLRFLQEHEFERVGSNQTIKVNVRIITATNRDLLQRVKEGLFREDLYYRLNVVQIEAPSLRERPDDIPLLAMHFLTRFAKENEKKIQGFSAETLDKMMRYHWPGNVRELENAIERAVVLCRGDEIQLEALPGSVSNLSYPDNECPPIPGAQLAEIERFAIVKTLEYTGGSTSRAAEILGISARKIQYKLQDYKE